MTVMVAVAVAVIDGTPPSDTTTVSTWSPGLIGVWATSISAVVALVLTILKNGGEFPLVMVKVRVPSLPASMSLASRVVA